MKRIITLILIVFFVKGNYAQAELGDILFENFEYELASKYYKNADSLNKNQLKNHALCFYFNNDFNRALPLFKKALEKDTGNNFLKYHYAVSLKSTGRYISAKKIFKVIQEKDSLSAALKLHLISIDSLMKWDTIHFFKKLASFEQLNSNASEFSPSFYDNGIYYIVEKGGKKNLKNRNINLILNNDTLSPKEKKQFYHKIDTNLTYGLKLSPNTYLYQNEIDISQLFKDYSNPIPDSSIKSSKIIVRHKGFNITSYSNDFQKNIYYTRHPVKNIWSPENNNNPLIFSAISHEKKPKLKKRRHLKVRHLPNSFGSGEVSVTADGQTIYFTSDKKRGFGGTDIYLAHKTPSGKWSKAINLGPLVNTPFDEESPRIYDDSILYFSSSGWPGYGKADIYLCKILNDSVFNVKHLPYPVNSSGDDIHFALHPFDESIGVLNSDRSRGKGDEDIYFAHMIPVEPYVKGYVRLASDSSIQKGSIVTLFQKDNQEIKQMTTKINGVYRFSLDLNHSYKVCATKTGLSGCISVSADEFLFRHEKKDIFLDSISSIQDEIIAKNAEKDSSKLKNDYAKTIQGYIIDENRQKVEKAKIEFYNQKDSLIAKICSREDGFFRISINNDSYYIMASNGEKAGVLELNIDEDYKTDTIVEIMIYSRTALISGIVYDTNKLPSSNAVVRLLDSNNIEVERITTKEDGAYQLSLTTLRYYRIIATNYGITKDTSFYVNIDWGINKSKDLYLLKGSTVQGTTFFKDSVKIIDDVVVKVESGFDSKYISIYSDKNGFFQFPLFNDSLLYMDGLKSKMKGTTTVNIDTNFNTNNKNNIYLHNTMTNAHGIVVYSNDSVAPNVSVELIDKDGKIVRESKTDSLGSFSFQLNTDSDYEIYASDGELESIENLHTGILWNKNNNIILKLLNKGTPTFGMVVDANERLPLSFVKVTLTDSLTNLKNITYTDDQGIFEMSLKKNSTNYIKLEKQDYFSKTVIVKIGDIVPKIIDLNKGFNLNLTKSNFKIDPIYFEFDSHKVTNHSKIELNKLASWLKGHKERVCTIYGYTDCRGKQSYNLILSKNRANTVKQYLSDKGIGSKRISIVARGATNYVNNCYSTNQCTEAEHRQNRRCEFEINDN